MLLVELLIKIFKARSPFGSFVDRVAGAVRDIARVEPTSTAYNGTAHWPRPDLLTLGSTQLLSGVPCTEDSPLTNTSPLWCGLECGDLKKMNASGARG